MIKEPTKNNFIEDSPYKPTMDEIEDDDDDAVEDDFFYRGNSFKVARPQIFRVLFDEDEKEHLYKDINGFYGYLLEFLEDNITFINHIKTTMGIYYNLKSLVENFSTQTKSRFHEFLEELGIEKSQIHSIAPDIYIKFLQIRKDTTSLLLIFKYYQVTYINKDSKHVLNSLFNENTINFKMNYLSAFFYNELVVNR